ncbi:MAG TPA: hypothetical protein VHW67_05745 [Solirubrobacteraceae bacterium]|jgi:hypothetical protein|nr:hypothetical protein [Solirubrobacteraceae bacterium]
MPKKRKPTRKRVQRITVRGELRPEPDWDKYAWALLQHARLLSADKAKKPNPRKEKP